MKSPALVDSEDPIANLLCEVEARLSETFESGTVEALQGRAPVRVRKALSPLGTLNLLGF